jgi:hypothetical protein
MYINAFLIFAYTCESSISIDVMSITSLSQIEICDIDIDDQQNEFELLVDNAIQFRLTRRQFDMMPPCHIKKMIWAWLCQPMTT